MENEKLDKCLKQAKEWFNSGNDVLVNIALKLFTEEELKEAKNESDLPNSWEEFCATHKIEPEGSFITVESEILQCGSESTRNPKSDANALPNMQYAEAILALMKLIQLRDCYRQGWKPDWKESYPTKYVIDFEGGKTIADEFWTAETILAFPNERIRDKFLENFKDLIEKVKYLYE